MDENDNQDQSEHTEKDGIILLGDKQLEVFEEQQSASPDNELEQLVVEECIISTDKSNEQNLDGDPQTAEKNFKFVIVNKNTIHNPSCIANISPRFLCIEYPGIVENVNNMIETLGGIRSIEMAVGNPNRRLELRFRPDDIFSKPCWGDKDLNPSILVKISVRQPKINDAVPSSSKNPDPDIEYLSKYRYEVVGLTAMSFKFTRLCDFQYLPLIPKNKKETPNSECQNIHDDIMPSNLPNLKWFQAEKSVLMPLFLLPPIFSKFNSSKENKLFYERYRYYEKVMPEVAERLKKESQKKTQSMKNIICRSRAVRKANSIFVNFNLKDVNIPQGPCESAIAAIKQRGLDHCFEKVSQLFKERPIWSKSAVLHKSGIRGDRLKHILPVVAYHCPNGPWRVMWCRFGYDPRLDSSSRVYQTFDFRVRASDGSKVKVQAKRSYSSSLMHYKSGPNSNNKFSLKNCSAAEKTKFKATIDESFYILKPNVLPPARQMFYQYCHVEIPEIQAMLARLPSGTKETYHPKNGWLPNGFSDQCREIVNKYITDQVRKLLLEEKKKKDEEEIAQSLQKTFLNLTEMETQSVEDAIPRMIESPIVIDDDDDDGNLKQNDSDEGHSGGEDDVSDSDDENGKNSGRNECAGIAMEAVDEINKIIGNMNESDTIQDNNEAKDESEEEFDHELVNLYRKLIISNVDKQKDT